MSRTTFFFLVFLSSAARGEPPAPLPEEATAVVTATVPPSTTVDYNGTRFGPFPVDETAVAWSADGKHFALAYKTRTKHWTMVIDGQARSFLGPDKIHALQWAADGSYLLYHQHWNQSRSDIILRLPH